MERKVTKTHIHITVEFSDGSQPIEMQLIENFTEKKCELKGNIAAKDAYQVVDWTIPALLELRKQTLPQEQKDKELIDKLKHQKEVHNGLPKKKVQKKKSNNP